MKPFAFFIFFSLTSLVCVVAQERKSITINTGADNRDLVNSIYSFSDFSTGRVYFKDGTVSSAKLNYNQYSNDIEFIGSKGDTLTIADKINVDSIKVLGKVFIYNGTFLEIVKENAVLRLAKRTTVILTNKEKKGAFGITNYTTDIESFDGIERTKQYKLKYNENLLYTKKSEWYLGTGTHFLASTERNLYKLFPSLRAKLTVFVKDSHINFQNESDLSRLLEFIKRQV
jgi:hypothetical protein